MGQPGGSLQHCGDVGSPGKGIREGHNTTHRVSPYEALTDWFSCCLTDARPPRYTPVCARLLSQYKTLFKLVEDSIPSLEAFLSEYRVSAVPFALDVVVG